MSDPVVLLTDFGSGDTYAGALIGACWRVDPALRVVTASHGVPPGDVLAGAYHLKAAAFAFPRGSVFCAVVDPGVGSERRALAVDTGEVRCIAPDNGLLSYLWSEADGTRRRCAVVAVLAGASPTFHGRDVLAPAAARLAAGADLDDLGEPAVPPMLLDVAFGRRGRPLRQRDHHRAARRPRRGAAHRGPMGRWRDRLGGAHLRGDR